MTRIITTIALVLALGSLTLGRRALGQSAATPDFSGTWVLNTGKSTLAKDSTVKSETVIVDYKKSAITFHYKTDGKKSTEKYIPDGQPRVTENMKSGQLISKASWQDSALVIESTLQIKVPNVTVSVSGLKPIVDRWTLGPDGRTLTHEAPDSKEMFVYDKQ